MEVTYSKKEGTLTIVLPVKKPLKPTKAGNSLMVATTSGWVTTDATIEGNPIRVSVNAVVKPD